MKKFLLLGLMLITMLCFTSCASLDIPEGDIKDFVSKFDGEYAFTNVHYGTSYITNTHYDGNVDEEGSVVVGTHTSLARFDKRDDEYYHYIETNASGKFYGENANYNFKNQRTVCYGKDDANGVYVEQITDGVSDDLQYDLDDVIMACQNFFFTEVNAGFHTGGVYYGDYILKNISTYYKHFSLNADKTELTFEINISTPTEDGNEIVNVHKFVVNSYGLILSVNTTAYYITNDKVTSSLVTTMTCDYVTEFEKIRKL